MKSSAPGKNTSAIEVTHISAHGIWLLAQDEEFFMSYEHFPWFKEQPVNAILNVQQLSQDHYYWPEIDVDLSKAIIKNHDRFPLKAKIT